MQHTALSATVLLLALTQVHETRGKIMSVIIRYSGPSEAVDYLVGKLEAAGCRPEIMESQDNGLQASAEIAVTAARGAINAAVAPFHEAHGGPGVITYANYEHFWQGIVPGDPDSLVHALERRAPRDYISLCSITSAERRGGRFSLYEDDR